MADQLGEKKIAGPETRERRHQAAIKAWQKRKRKGQEGAAGGQAIAQAKDAAGRGRIDSAGQESLGFKTGQVGGPIQSRGDFAGDKWSSKEKSWQGTPQKSCEYNCGKGISEAYKLYLEDGTKGNFKPSRGEVPNAREGIQKGQMAERELGAWEVAKLVGMDDMVAPVVIRRADVPGGRNARRNFPAGKGIRGSMAVWQEGEVAKFLGDEQKYDGQEDLRRSAMFDYIIGNQDRHHGNWVISESGKMKLIDHGMSFGETRRGWGNHQLLRRVSREGASKSPSEYAKSYMKNKLKIKDALMKLKLPANSIDRVMNRIDRAATATDWADLYRDDD